MTLNQEEQVRTLIKRMAPEGEPQVSDDQRLVHDLGFESIRLVELTMALESMFDLPRHEPHQLMDVHTVADVIALVAREAGGRSDG